MTNRDQRWVARIACDIPARVLTRDGWCSASVRDLSRLGTRLGVSPVDIDLPPSASIGTLARRLAEILPEEPALELHHRRLGVLVGRRLRIVRVRPARGNSPMVELGCLFDRPLDDDESAALGIVLPRAGETLEDANRRHSPRPPKSREPDLPPDAQALEDGFFEGLLDDGDVTEA